MLSEPRDNPLETETPARAAGPIGVELNPVEEIRKNPLRSLWRRRWIVFACALIGLAIGSVVYYLSDPVYEGRARILVSQSGPKLLQQDFPGTLATGSMWLQTQCDVIRSPEILRRVKDAPGVLDLPMFKPTPSWRETSPAI
ncbi:MAG: Wzz/FepE/Etk N-terminal domain-containing protein [Phycisphaerae bacterium]|nr:Wzz/FepE/Etk N-terminal domain-containing protein [Phycisphaerae bacterium]MDW8261546.1 Wzz/FepE/Etk N-terminal domain-containing protein [Phycisphaerales bacterium]